MRVQTFALIVFLICASSFAQQPNTYGTLSETSVTVGSFAFEVSFQGITWAVLDYQRYVTNTFGCCLVAPVTLPAGASIVGIELEACDDSTTGAVIGSLLRCPTPGGSCTIASPPLSTGDAFNGGCGLFRANLSPALTVDNLANSYMFQVGNNGDLSGNARFRSVRIYYKLQISPDPASATFTDVPVGHPLHRFVEALVAAGITGGCGSGNYCPDAPITRGQMAVFLSAALGLHWAP